MRDILFVGLIFMISAAAAGETEEEILESGIDQILIISGHAKRAIEDHSIRLPSWNPICMNMERCPF